MTSVGSPALLLDRDGTLIRDVGYPRDPADVELLPGVAGLREAREVLGYQLVIVGNQSGVARGQIQPDEAAAVQEAVVARLGAEGIVLDGAYFCFHGPDDACPCRKPAPGLLLRAAQDLRLDLGSSLMIGDRASDAEAGLAAGCSALTFGAHPHPGALGALSSWFDLGPWLRAAG